MVHLADACTIEYRRCPITVPAPRLCDGCSLSHRVDPPIFGVMFTIVPRWLLRSSLLLTLLAGPGMAAELYSYAAVRSDGTLVINNTVVHLYGIHIPDTGRTCSALSGKVVCGTRGVLALEAKVDRFVKCEVIDTFADGSVEGWCRINASAFSEGDDLSAYLLEEGWAVAFPRAPIDYHTKEKIARSRGIGVWGTPADIITRQN